MRLALIVASACVACGGSLHGVRPVTSGATCETVGRFADPASAVAWLGQKSSPDAPLFDGHSLLEHAAECGRTDFVAALLKAGADPTDEDALLFAVEANAPDVIRLLIAMGRVDVKKKPELVDRAIEADAADSLAALLAAGVEPDANILATAGEHPSVIPLLAARVKVDEIGDALRQELSRDVPDLATVHELVDAALPRQGGRKQLGETLEGLADKRVDDVVTALLARGIGTRAERSAALAKAAGNGDLPLVEALLGAGAEASAGEKAAIGAARLDVFRRLRAAGAKLKAEDAYAAAVQSEEVEVIEALLDAGIPPGTALVTGLAQCGRACDPIVRALGAKLVLPSGADASSAGSAA
jgi:hypothetical protein